MAKYFIVISAGIFSIFLLLATFANLMVIGFLLSNDVGRGMLFKKIEVSSIIRFFNLVYEKPRDFYSVLVGNFNLLLKCDGVGFIWPVVLLFIILVFYFLSSNGIFKYLYTPEKLKYGLRIFLCYFLSLTIVVNLFSLPIDFANQTKNPFLYLFLFSFFLAVSIISLPITNPVNLGKFFAWFTLRLVFQFAIVAPIIFSIFFFLFYLQHAPSLLFQDLITNSPETIRSTPFLFNKIIKFLFLLISALVIPANIPFFFLTNILLIGESYCYAKKKLNLNPSKP